MFCHITYVLKITTHRHRQEQFLIQSTSVSRHSCSKNQDWSETYKVNNKAQFFCASKFWPGKFSTFVWVLIFVCKMFHARNALAHNSQAVQSLPCTVLPSESITFDRHFCVHMYVYIHLIQPMTMQGDRLGKSKQQCQ